MRKLPPLGELRAFEAAARHLSFNRAAEELAVTPTAISHQVKLLEQYCGLALFHRRPRPMTLTDAGAALYPLIRDGLDAFADALSSIKQQSERQLLKVTTTNAFASKWLVPRLSRWRDAHPGITLEVIGTDAVLDLAAGEADLAIRYMYAAPSGFIAHELFRDAFVAVCCPWILPGGHPLQSLADLRSHTLVHSYWSSSDTNAPTWQRWLEAASAVYPEVPRLHEMEHLSFREELHAIDAVSNGQGILIVSDVLVERELKEGTLVKAMEFSMPGYGFYVTYLPDHPYEAMIESFLSSLRGLRCTD
jgi:LysR family transcriptional regulator, glycine cleavage system transcriptional activator